MTAQAPSQKIFRRFTAVDLVTIAVFAAIYRSMLYVWSAVSFVFPFNITANTFVCVLGGVAASVIIRKFGVFTMFTVAAQLINVLLQGEALAGVIAMFFWGVAADLYVYVRLRAGADPFSSFRDMFIAGILNAVVWSAITWGIVFPLVLQIELEPTVHVAVGVLCTIAGIIGGALGYLLGDKMKGLIS